MNNNFDKLYNNKESWERYFYKYPQGVTILEQLTHWISTVNLLIEDINNTNQYIDKFSNKFDNELKTTLNIIIDDMKKNGEFDNFLANVLGKLDEFKAKLVESKSYIDSSDYFDDDEIKNEDIDNTEKLQELINLGNEYKKPIFLKSGIYTVSGNDIIKIKSNTEIYGEGESSIIKISKNNGNWNSIFYSDSNSVIENVIIRNINFDCNILNTNVTLPNYFESHNARCPIFLPLSKNIKIYENIFNFNGFWCIRSKTLNSSIKNNIFYFNNNNIPDFNFDTSTIWIGGYKTIIKDNEFYSTKRDNIVCRTAIENQGHYNIIENNFIDNYFQGIILTNTTLYENSQLNITEKGNISTKIRNNNFNVQIGIRLWLMNTGNDSIMKNLEIQNNTFNISTINSSRETKAIVTYRPTAQLYENANQIADGKQSGKIENIIIKNNVFNGKDNIMAIDLTPIYDIINCIISENVFNEFYTCLRTGLFSLYDNNRLVYANDNNLENFIIKNNVFNDTIEPILLLDKFKSGMLIDNTFIRNKPAIANESGFLIKINIKRQYDLYCANNTINYRKDIKPFIPTLYANFYEYKYVRTPFTDDKASVKLKDVSYRTSSKMQLTSKDLLLENGVLKKTGSSYGDTQHDDVTQPKTSANSEIIIIDKDLKPNTTLTPSTITVNDAENIFPYDVLKLKDNSNGLTLNTLPVLAVIQNKLVLGFNQGDANIINKVLVYSNNIINA